MRTLLPWDSLKHGEKGVRLQYGQDTLRCIDGDRRELTHKKQAQDVVKIGRGQEDANDRRVAQALFRMRM